MTKYQKILYLLDKKVYPRWKVKDQPLLLRYIRLYTHLRPTWILGKAMSYLSDENGDNIIDELVDLLETTKLALGTTILGCNSAWTFHVEVKRRRESKRLDYTFSQKPNSYQQLVQLHTNFEDE